MRASPDHPGGPGCSAICCSEPNLG